MVARDIRYQDKKEFALRKTCYGNVQLSGNRLNLAPKRKAFYFSGVGL
jgi:hypothetical protein